MNLQDQEDFCNFVVDFAKGSFTRILHADQQKVLRFLCEHCFIHHYTIHNTPFLPAKFYLNVANMTGPLASN